MLHEMQKNAKKELVAWQFLFKLFLSFYNLHDYLIIEICVYYLFVRATTAMMIIRNIWLITAQHELSELLKITTELIEMWNF